MLLEVVFLERECGVVSENRVGKDMKIDNKKVLRNWGGTRSLFGAQAVHAYMSPAGCLDIIAKKYESNQEMMKRSCVMQ